jgi:predicted permease
MRIGASFDRVLGVEPAAGRLFELGDFHEGAGQVVVLSHGIWQQEFGGDRGVVGLSLSLDDRPHRIVGVLPPMPLRYPRAEHDIWVPLLPRKGAPWEHSRGTGWISAVGRVGPTSTVDQAATELGAIARHLAESHPATNKDKTGVRLLPLHEDVVGGSRRALLLVAAAVITVLVVACANTTNLLLAFAERRRRDFAVRLAIGASRGRLSRQVAIETLALVLPSAGLGVALSPLLVGAFLDIYPAAVPRRDEIGFSPEVLGATLLMALVTAAAMALPQLQQVRRSQVRPGVGSGRATPDRGERRARFVLLASQVAMSVLLLFSGVALLQTVMRLARVDPGFRPDGVVAFGLSPSPARFGSAAQTRTFFESVLEGVHAVPGVRAAAAATGVPFVASGWAFGITRESPSGPERILVKVTTGSPRYFEALGMRLIAGRILTDVEHRTEARVIVVNEPLARVLGRADTVVGKALPYSGQQWEIAGVVAGARQARLAEPPGPELYLPWSQAGRAPQTVIVRTDGDPLSLVPAIAARVHAVDPSAPLARITRLDTPVAESMAADRFRATLVGGLALVAVLLAALGVSSVTSFTAARLERENAIRAALGERGGALLWRMQLIALRPAAIGAMVGCALAWIVAGFLAAFLYEVQPRDPALIAAAAVTLVALAAAAAWRPARRAARLDPATVLRAE